MQIKEADFEQLPKTLRKFFRSRRVPMQDVEDLAQETLLRVLQLSRKASPDSPEAFAIGVAKHVLSEYWKRVKKFQSHDGLSVAVGLVSHSNPLTDVLRQERVALFRKVLALLPEHMGSLLIRRFMEEVPGSTIAREEGVSTNAIDIRVHKAKCAFTKLLERECRPHATRAA